MLATSVRESPCSARTLPSSFGRVTLRVLSSREISMGEASSSARRPLGPLTLTSRPLIVTSPPPGISTRSRPRVDIAVRLPDVGEHFPPYPTLVRLLVGHQAVGGGDDRDAEAAEDPGQVVLLRVHPQAGLGDPLDARDGTLPGRPELQGQHQALAYLGVFHGVAR